MSEVRESVKTMIQILHDSHKAFQDIGEHLKDPEAKRFFLEEANTRAKFENELKHAAHATEDVGGTALGSARRVWGDLKASFGGGDHTLLATAEQGEDAAKKAYEEALRDKDVHSSIREVLVRQQSHIQQAHDRVKSFRDAKAA